MNYFGTFLTKDNEFLKIIDNKLNSLSESKSYLQNFILYLFEYKISIYFSSFEEKETIFSEDVIEQVKKAINMLNQIISNPEICKFPKISSIYFVAFIKNFANILVKVLLDNSNHEDLIQYFNDVVSPENVEEHSKILKMIKLYSLKILMRESQVTYEKFEKTDFNKLQLNWANEFFNLDKENEEDKSFLNTIFSGLDNFELFEKIMQKFVLFNQLKFEKNEDWEKYFSDFDSQSVICLYDCTINQIMGRTLKEDYVKQENFRIYNKWINEKSNFFSKKFDNCQLIQKLLTFWKNYSDQKYLTFHNLASEEFEMKIIAYKAVLLIFSSNKNGAYGSVLNNLDKSLFDCYLPGGDQKDALILQSGYTAIKRLIANGFGVNEGIYVCSCGKEYTVPPCSFPVCLSTCEVCLEIIGGENHVIHNRPYYLLIN